MKKMKKFYNKPVITAFLQIPYINRVFGRVFEIEGLNVRITWSEGCSMFDYKSICSYGKRNRYQLNEIDDDDDDDLQLIS